MQYLEHARPEQVDTDGNSVGLRFCRLLLEIDDPAALIELGDAEAMRVGDRLENSPGAGIARQKLVSECPQRSAEDVVPEDDRYRAAIGEVTREANGVRNPQSPALVPIGEIQADVRSVMEQL